MGASTVHVEPEILADFREAVFHRHRQIYAKLREEAGIALRERAAKLRRQG